MRSATGDNDFEYNANMKPFPLCARIKTEEKTGNGVFLSFMFAISFALVPIGIINNMITE